MSILRHHGRPRRGFVLLLVLVLLFGLAVMALALNRQAGLHLAMAANGHRAAQVHAGRQALLARTYWDLTRDPCLRTAAGGETLTFSGAGFTRRVTASAAAGYAFAVIAAVGPADGGQAVTRAFGYYIDTLETPAEGYTFTPGQICLDGSGRIYLADSTGHRVLRVDPAAATCTVVAGSGAKGFGGDGGDALAAELDSPRGVALDAAGNLIVADTANHCLRRVEAATGEIATIAGQPGFLGSMGNGGPAVDAKLKNPAGVALDAAGNIFVADTGNHQIRRIDAATGIIERYAGTGTMGDAGAGGPATEAELIGPKGIILDGSGDLYIADTGNHRICRVTAADGLIDDVAGSGVKGYGGDGGAATGASLDGPQGVWADAAGNLWIADTANHAVRFVAAATGNIATLAGDGAAGYSGDGGAAAAAELSGPASVCANALGEYWIADTANGVLRRVDATAAIDTVYIAPTPGASSPAQLALAADGSLYAADTGSHRILRRDAAGDLSAAAGSGTAGFAGDGAAAAAARLNSPEGVAAAADGSLYIADTRNHVIRRVDPSGTIGTLAGTAGSAGFAGDGGPAAAAELNEPCGLALDADGHLYVADRQNHRIRRIDAASGVITTAAGTGTAGFGGDGGPAADADLNRPAGVYVDAQGDLYIADTDNHRIRRVAAAGGVISTVAGTGVQGYGGDGGPAVDAQLDQPRGVRGDAPGNLFIADSGNHRLRVVSVHDGTIATLAGTGSGGYNGDGRPAFEVKLNQPSSVAMAAVRGGARIFIADGGNDRIRAITLAPVPFVYR